MELEIGNGWGTKHSLILEGLGAADVRVVPQALLSSTTNLFVLFLWVFFSLKMPAQFVGPFIDWLGRFWCLSFAVFIVSRY